MLIKARVSEAEDPAEVSTSLGINLLLHVYPKQSGGIQQNVARQT